MCQTEGETNGNNRCVSRRTAKKDACLPPTRMEEEESVAEIRLPSHPAQRASRAQKVAAISLAFFVVVSVGVRYSKLGDGSSWWSAGELQDNKARDVTEGQHPHTEEARKFRPWYRRTKRTKSSSSLVEATLQEGQDPWRSRKARRAPPPEASPEVGQNQKPEKRKRAESPRGHRRNLLHNALWKLWKRVFRKGRGRQHAVDHALGAGAEAEEKTRILEEFRDIVRRHPGDLLRRAREVRQELDDGMLIRYLDTGFWSLEAGGTPLTNAIESTVRWREEVAPHLITDTDVVEEAKDGKIYVRGHDRDGRPIIFYTPGLEQSFNVREGLKLLYHTLEKATALLPRGQNQFAVVADCAGFGPSKVPPLEMINIAFSTLQEHYTMRLGYVIIVNASGPITVVWKLISSVLAERTKEKIVFVTRKEAAAVLSRHIDPSLLPSTLPGGLDNFRYSNGAYLST